MSKWLYREHRGGLKESMATLKKFNSLYEMIRYISTKEECKMWDIDIEFYTNAPDERIGWKYTYLVSIQRQAWGFCTECDDS